VNDGSALTGGEVLLERVPAQGWWLVVEEPEGDERVVAGPFADRVEAGWAGVLLDVAGAHPVFGMRGADGAVRLCPSPEEWAWLAHLGDQLDRLTEDWDPLLSDEDPLTTLVVEITASLSEAGLPLHDADGPGAEIGGACLIPQPQLGGIVVTWRQHDRMTIDQVHGTTPTAAVQHIMNRAVADVLAARGFLVDTFGGASGHVVRPAA
jgi:hypothetical protein